MGLQKGLQVQIEKGNASVESDKVHILNCIAGGDLELPPLATHPNYNRVNRGLRAVFALAGWRQLEEQQLVSQWGLPGILAADEDRLSVSFCFIGYGRLEDPLLGNIAAGL